MKMMAKGMGKKAAKAAVARKLKVPHLKALKAVNKTVKKMYGKGPGARRGMLASTHTT